MRNEFPEEKLLPELIEACRAAEKIIVGLSGGADSVALTHYLFTQFGREKILCAHVNHLLRGEESFRDEQFAAEFCRENGLTLRVLREDVACLARERGLSEESCGREVRYRFFQELAEPSGTLIATAHNADDNFETMLLHLARGCGLRGLCGIPPRRGRIIRPLLLLTREEIEEYCRQNGLQFVTDSTNLSDDHSRNLVRHKIMPVLKEINAGALHNASRTSASLREDLEYLEGQAAEFVLSARRGRAYDMSGADSLPDAVLLRALDQILKEQGCPSAEEKHLRAVKALLASPGSLSVPGGKLVTVKQRLLTVTDPIPKPLERQELKLGENRLSDGRILVLRLKTAELEKSDKKIHNLLFLNSIDYDTINSVLTAGSRAEGDSMALPGRGITKSLKKLFCEKRIPAALRGGTVVLRDGDNVVFVEGIGPASQYAVTEKTERAVEIALSGFPQGTESRGKERT